MRTNLPSSEFFKHHEIVGSSLLFVYDDEDNATVTMLDFGKTMPSKEPLRHDVPYVYPTLSHEEGYLVGVENLIKIITATGAGPEYAEYA
jgi:1D-myo-inositol-triphosphate 3-kinase